MELNYLKMCNQHVLYMLHSLNILIHRDQPLCNFVGPKSHHVDQLLRRSLYYDNGQEFCQKNKKKV